MSSLSGLVFVDGVQLPVAKHLVADVHATSEMDGSLRFGLGMMLVFHVRPFHLALPSFVLPRAVSNVPTATQLRADTQDTAP